MAWLTSARASRAANSVPNSARMCLKRRSGFYRASACSCPCGRLAAITAVITCKGILPLAFRRAAADAAPPCPNRRSIRPPIRPPSGARSCRPCQRPARTPSGRRRPRRDAMRWNGRRRSPARPLPRPRSAPTKPTGNIFPAGAPRRASCRSRPSRRPSAPILASLAESHAPATIRRRLAALGKMHRFNDLPVEPGTPRHPGAAAGPAAPARTGRANGGAPDARPAAPAAGHL